MAFVYRSGAGPQGLLPALLVLLLSLCTVATATRAAEPGAPLNILFLSTYSRHYPSTVELEAGFDDALQFSKNVNNFFAEYLDSPLLPDSDVEAGLAEYLTTKYRSHAPDYIVAWAPTAYRFLHDHPGLFPASRHIYLETAQSGSPATGNDNQQQPMLINVKADFAASLRELDRLTHPQRLVVFGANDDRSAQDRLVLFKEAVADVLPTVETEYLFNRSSAEIIAGLNKTDGKRSAGYFLLQFRDADGNKTPYNLLQRVAAGSHIPVFSLWDSLMGSGMVGGAQFQHREVGQRVGRMLQEGSVTGTSLELTLSSLSYDWEAFGHWQLDTGLIPPGGRVINRPTNLLYTYRFYAMAVAAVILLLSYLAFHLARSVRERDAALADLESERRGLADKVTERTESLANTIAVLNTRNTELQQHLNEIKTLRGIIPICSFCKKVRDDQGYWEMVERYIGQHSEAQFSHGVCPDCLEREYRE